MHIYICTLSVCVCVCRSLLAYQSPLRSLFHSQIWYFGSGNFHKCLLVDSPF